MLWLAYSLNCQIIPPYVCAIALPTRCSLLFGMNASRHRVTNWTLELNQNINQASEVISLPEWNYNGIQPAQQCRQDQ